jgi:acetolactate synthase-1/2/3 large subunit
MTDRQDLNSDPDSVAAWIATLLEARGVTRVFGLQGGHIQPDLGPPRAPGHRDRGRPRRRGGRPYGARPYGTDGRPGRGHGHRGAWSHELRDRHCERIPRPGAGALDRRLHLAPQANMGPLQDIPHVDIMRPVTRYSRTARVAEQVIRELDEAIARAMGDMGEPGPAYIEVPTDVCARASARR